MEKKEKSLFGDIPTVEEELAVYTGNTPDSTEVDNMPVVDFDCEEEMPCDDGRIFREAVLTGDVDTLITEDTGSVINNGGVEAPEKLPEGTLLNDKYEIIGPLGISAGEADLYLCSCDGKVYVAKLYRHGKKTRDEVADILMSLSSPYVVPLIDKGFYNSHPFRILPYFKNGSLRDKKFSMEELKNFVIPCINEGLRALHEKSVIHRDIKPSNIMLSDDGKSVLISDFGISSFIRNGDTLLTSVTGRTPEFTAPEVYNGLCLKEADYYSLGITVYMLYCGHTPFQNLTADEIAEYTAEQRIPFPGDMPEELKNLISALTYYDVRNRDDKKNPHRRWTYEEVDKWCRGEEQPLPDDFSDFSFPDFLNYALSHEINSDEVEDSPDMCARTGAIGFFWDGRSYENISDLGAEMLEKLWDGDTSDSDYWDRLMNMHVLSRYLNGKGIEQEQAKALRALEIEHKNTSKDNERGIMVNYYNLAYLLSEEKEFAICEKCLKSVEELAEHMKELLASSYEEFEAFCHSLIDYDDTLDVRFEAWLLSLGKEKELEEWRNNLNT